MVKNSRFIDKNIGICDKKCNDLNSNDNIDENCLYFSRYDDDYKGKNVLLW